VHQPDPSVSHGVPQEFVETQRSVNGAPPCSFSRTPPMELRPLNLGIKRPVPKRGAPNEVEEGIAGYISFGKVIDNQLRAICAGGIAFEGTECSMLHGSQSRFTWRCFNNIVCPVLLACV
jgi:hypothetical protein